MAKANNSHRDKEFSESSRLLQEICERFLQDCSAFNKANSEKCQVCWTDKCEEHFQLLKDLLTTAPVLTLPSGDEGFTVYCDASRVGLGCVLMQM